MKKSILAIAVLSLMFAGCTDEYKFSSSDYDPADINAAFAVNVELPGTYTASGTSAALPASMLTVLGTTADEFISGLGSTVKVGYTTQTASPYDLDQVTWGSAEWFNASGVKASSDKAVSIEVNKDYTTTVNIAEDLSGKEATYIVTLVFQTAVEGANHTAFVKYTIKSQKLYDLASATTSFSLTQGIVAQVQLAVKQTGRTYREASIDLPASVYATLKQIQGSYDNLAYFISSGQIKSYAFPKCAGLGSQTTDAWFDKTGAECAADGGLHASLYLEPGNPIQGGGKYVKVNLDQAAGKLSAGDKFNCGFIFVYGSTKIPLILMVNVVSEL